MKIKYSITEGTINEFENYPVVMFGASGCAELLLDKYNLKKILYFVDNDSKKWGSKFRNCEICGPDRLLREDEKKILIISSQYFDDIVNQLNDMGYKGTVYSGLHLLYTREYNKDFVKNASESLEKVKSLLVDNKSREILDFIIDSRLSDNKDYRPICTKDQYFIDDMPLTKDEIIVDCGAYTGDTIEQVYANLGSFDKIYAFEMDALNFAKLKYKYSECKDIILYNKGVWNCKETMKYDNSGSASSLSTEGSQVAQVDCLDDMIDGKITYLKMDIEGAEYNALCGAEKLIKKYHPKLAICLYHKEDDLWEIPLLIHKMVPEYKFIIRHHAIYHGETVLYAYC